MTTTAADTAQPTITLRQLIEQLARFEGETVTSAGGLAIAIFKGARGYDPEDEEG